MTFACDAALDSCGKHFPMKDTSHMTEKLTLIFSLFLWVMCRFSINIRIEGHFLFALGNDRTPASRFTRFTRDRRLFISQCKQKVYFNPEIKMIKL